MTDDHLDAHALAEAGLLLPTGVPGLFHRAAAFERIVRGVEALVGTAGADLDARAVYLSPLQDASTLERSGYVTSFPNLLGAVSALPVDAAAEVARAPSTWAGRLEPTGVTLCSAACHGLYPLIEAESFTDAGTAFEVQCFCFRHEPSDDPARQQWFRQHEFVRIGAPGAALAHRDDWLSRGASLLADLGLEVDVVVANDPFFGRAAALMAESQRDKALKYEITAPIATEEPRAIASANYHEAHFGEAFSLELEDGSPAHTACIGFGLERVALALLRRHGLDPGDWPAAVADHVLGARQQGRSWRAG